MSEMRIKTRHIWETSKSLTSASRITTCRKCSRSTTSAGTWRWPDLIWTRTWPTPSRDQCYKTYFDTPEGVEGVINTWDLAELKSGALGVIWRKWIEALNDFSTMKLICVKLVNLQQTQIGKYASNSNW